MKMKTLLTAMLMTIPASSVFAAALDRSGQSIAGFLQPNNYFDASLSVLDPDVSGKEAGTLTTRRNISDMGDDYEFGQATFKLQPTKNFSFGILYDQPFGADAAYTGDNAFVSSSTDTILGAQQLASIRESQITTNTETTFNALTAEQRVGAALQAQGVVLTTPAGQAQLAQTLNAYNNVPAVKAQIDAGVKEGVQARVTQVVDQGLDAVNKTVGGTGGGTRVKISTHNLSLLLGFQPNENWNFYAGPVYQSVEGKVRLRGQAYSIYNGYDLTIKQSEEWGWLAGLAYQIPDIALKASLTYRSEIDYDVTAAETIPTLSALSLLGKNPATISAAQGKTRVTTPKSVNLDFQTGIMANTIAFANLRWVPWSDFTIQPTKFGVLSKAVGPLINQPNGFNLVQYKDDQWSANVGVGRKFSDKWSGTGSVGWDSGAGNPVTTLGPTEGFWNVGLGVQYSPAPNYFIAGGLKYIWLGDAKAQTGAQAGTDAFVGEFEDNNAMAYGLKIGYRF